MSTAYTTEQHEALQRIADFDHVFIVDEDGSVHETISSLYAPEALDPDTHATTLDGWQLPLSGLTGQYGYDGPWLHDSEVIPGGVAERVLSMPGYWVAIYAQWTCDADWHIGTDSEPCEESHIEGWTLAYQSLTA